MEISDFEREKWTAVAEREIASKLASGTIVEVDESKESHRKLAEIAREVAQENGLDPKVYILPIQGETAEERAAHARASLGGFSASLPVNAVIIPESAAEFFTRGETAAVLNHEMDHLVREDLFYEKVRAVETAEESMKEAHFHKSRGSHPQQVAEVESKRDGNVARLSDISTTGEVEADNRAIDHGHASDLASALKKMEIARSAPADADKYPPEDVINYVSAIQAQQRGGMDPVKAAQHTAETFVQRLQRLDNAAKDEPSRGR